MSIGASAPIVTYGSGITLAGVVSTGLPNETVQIYAQPFGQASFALAATILTGAGGAWSYATKPDALTLYKARWGNRESVVATIGVAPSISLRKIGPWWVVKTVGARKFSRRAVTLQRLNAFGQWVSLKKVTLNSSGAQRFKVKLPKGRQPPADRDVDQPGGCRLSRRVQQDDPVPEQVAPATAPPDQAGGASLCSSGLFLVHEGRRLGDAGAQARGDHRS